MRRTGSLRLKADPHGHPHRGTAPARLPWHSSPGYDWGTTDGSAAVAGAALGHGADVDLRGPSRLVAARARGGQPLLTYRELATQLADYVAEMGFTHVELLPVMDTRSTARGATRSTGYFAPTAATARPTTSWPSSTAAPARDRRDPRLGAGPLPEGRVRPRALRRHRLYEHADPRRGLAPGLGHARSSTTAAPRSQLPRSPTRSSGSRSSTSTASGSMRSRRCSTSTTRARPGEWMPNEYGGRENLEAVAFLRELNEVVHRRVPGRPSWSRRSRPRGRGLAPDRRRAASASASSGTWAGCTTRSTTSSTTRSTASTTTNELTFGLSTP